MKDTVVALCESARFALSHAVAEAPEGEARDRLRVSLAALNDGLTRRTTDVTLARTRRHLEVIADCAAPPKDAA